MEIQIIVVHLHPRIDGLQVSELSHHLPDLLLPPLALLYPLPLPFLPHLLPLRTALPDPLCHRLSLHRLPTHLLLSHLQRPRHLAEPAPHLLSLPLQLPRPLLPARLLPSHGIPRPISNVGCVIRGQPLANKFVQDKQPESVIVLRVSRERVEGRFSPDLERRHKMTLIQKLRDVV